MKFYLDALKGYFRIDGRSRRSEFWIFNAVNFFIFSFLFIVNFIVYDPDFERIMIVISSVLFLSIVVPTFTVSIRRLHDTGRDGWWMLLNLIPGLGTIVFLFMAMQDSTPGANEFGEYPKFKLYF